MLKAIEATTCQKNLMEAVSKLVFIRCKDFASLNNSLFPILPFFFFFFPMHVYSEPDLLVEMRVPFYELRYTVM